MSTKLSGRLSAYYIPARSFFVILGCLAVWWGIVEFPVFWQESSIERIARQIIAGDQFKIETLIKHVPILTAAEISTNCRPATVRSAAVIPTPHGRASDCRGRFGSFQRPNGCAAQPIRVSLSCSPADAFLWIVLFWVEAARVGVEPDDLKYLRMSYRLGPNEGWIAWKRNPFAFSIFEELPADLREAAIREFVGLVQSGFIDPAVDILTGPAWQVRDLILPRLAAVTHRRREEFSRELLRRGHEIPIPGIAAPTARPSM